MMVQNTYQSCQCDSVACLFFFFFNPLLFSMYSRFCHKARQLWLCGCCRGKPHARSVNLVLSVCVTAVISQDGSSTGCVAVRGALSLASLPWRCLPLRTGENWVSFQPSLLSSLSAMNLFFGSFYLKEYQ